MRDSKGAVRASCLLSVRTDRRAIVPLRRAFLNTSGEDDADSVVVEHNDVLCDPSCRQLAFDALADYVTNAQVDEFLLVGGSEQAVSALKTALPQWRAEVEWKDSPYVNLRALREAGHEYQSVLSRNTREQLRRSLRKYRERGPIALRVARSDEEARAMLGNLVRLHELRWQKRGDSGGFATATRRAFHECFVTRGALPGHAQLIEVTVGGELIGVLYNLVANGQVCFYQSGLLYESDPHLKPGFVVHSLAIEHYLQAGYSVYDFLPSAPNDGRYKSSLANEVARVGTLSLQRPGWRRNWFAMARGLKRGIRVRKA